MSKTYSKTPAIKTNSSPSYGTEREMQHLPWHSTVLTSTGNLKQLSATSGPVLN